jgi:hypothetical protein
MPWAYGWKKVLGQVSIHVGSPFETGERGLSTRNFERWMQGAQGMGHLSLKRLTVEGLKGGLIYCVPGL